MDKHKLATSKCRLMHMRLFLNNYCTNLTGECLAWPDKGICVRRAGQTERKKENPIRCLNMQRNTDKKGGPECKPKKVHIAYICREAVKHRQKRGSECKNKKIWGPECKRRQKSWTWTLKIGGVARIELATSRTRSENHTTRPNTQPMVFASVKFY